MSAGEFLNDNFTFITGFIITGAAVIGVLYKGMTWLRDEVKKENVAIRNDVKEENAVIKQETIQRVEQNRLEVKTVAENISKELTYTKEIIATKLDTIGEVTKENKISLESYAKNIGKTVERNNEKVNEHESRLSVLENQIRNFFASKSQPDFYSNDGTNRKNRTPSYDSHNNNES
jgi:archaellum component FlaG (FlaF/FlaG flagellin family)